MSIIVRDFDRSYRFYRDVLGMKRGFGPFFSGNNVIAKGMAIENTGTEVPTTAGKYVFCGWCEESQDTMVDLGTFYLPATQGTGYPGPNNRGWQHLGLKVRSLARTVERLVERGAAIEAGPIGLDVGFELNVAALRDPEGNLIQLVETPSRMRAADYEPDDDLFEYIHHYSGAVGDLDASIEYYTGTLGMSVEVEPFELSGEAVAEGFGLRGAAGARLRAAWLRVGPGHRRAYLQLVEWLSPKTEGEAFPVRSSGILGSFANQAGMPRLAFDVVDLHGWYGRLRGLGVTVLSEPQEVDLGIPGFTCQWVNTLDPDGLVVELFEYRKI